MKFPRNIPLYGDAKFRGACPKEDVEQVSFFNKIRREYPTSWGLIALHPRNEGLVYGGQFANMIKRKAEGMTTGASDIVIPGQPSFVCEMKRLDHTKSAWQDGQIAYLGAAQETGSFVCIALGAKAAWVAFQDYLDMYHGSVERAIA